MVCASLRLLLELKSGSWLNSVTYSFEGEHFYVTLLSPFLEDSLGRRACERQSSLLLQVLRQTAKLPGQKVTLRSRCFPFLLAISKCYKAGRNVFTIFTSKKLYLFSSLALLNPELKASSSCKKPCCYKWVRTKKDPRCRSLNDQFTFQEIKVSPCSYTLAWELDKRDEV